MSKKHQTSESEEKPRTAEEEREPREGTERPVTNAEGVQHFILTRGGMLSAHDEEAINTMLDKLGLDPKDAAATQPEPEPEPEQQPAAVGDGEEAPSVPSEPARDQA